MIAHRLRVLGPTMLASLLALVGCGRSELFAPAIALGSGAVDSGLEPDLDAASGPDSPPTRDSGMPADACPCDAANPLPDAAIVEPPSCATPGEGRTSCGDGTESCCTTLPVPGGTFYRTYTNDGTGPTGEQDPATVSSFRLDKYDVTVGRFRTYLDAVRLPDGGASWVPAPGSGKHTHVNGGKGLLLAGLVSDAGAVYEPGWIAVDNVSVENEIVAPADTDLGVTVGNLYPDITWTVTPGPNENKPLVFVAWASAQAFCIWDGGFLPSGAEWEYAAAGGNEQREYPWGSTSPGTNDDFAIYNCYYPTGAFADSGVCGTNSYFMAPVGTAAKGVGRWGQLDLTSNVYELTSDLAGAYVDPCVDCATFVEPSSFPFHASRGNTFNDPAAGLTPPSHLSDFASDRTGQVGFRCARAP